MEKSLVVGDQTYHCSHPCDPFTKNDPQKVGEKDFESSNMFVGFSIAEVSSRFRI